MISRESIPQREALTVANSTERIGIHHCAEIAERNNWLFREQPVNDIGIDAHIELVETSGKPKQLLAVQIKSGKSWFKEKRENFYIFRDINERQYNYWTMNSLPCIVVLYNPTDEMCIWQRLTVDTIERTKSGEGRGFFVKIPVSQIFIDEESNKSLCSFSNLPEHVTNYNFLLSQKKFMEIIRDGGTVKLHSIEWVNKSSGRGDTELIVDNGNSIQKYSYPYWFPFSSYTKVFPQLFPWASFRADEEFFYENDERLWRELNCFYDQEEHEWLVVGDSFEEFRKKLDPMRSIDCSGEVAEYMMNLGLNELGKSFLFVDNYVSQNQCLRRAILS